MFDHITLRVPDLAVATRAFAAVLGELEIEQTTSTPIFSVWGNFAITQTDDEHPIAQRVHIAFIAPTAAHVNSFGQAGIAAGFADDGSAGPRPDYADDYYAAFLKDDAGNGFEAVHRDSQQPRGNIDHVSIRVIDAEASTAFYSAIGPATGLTIRRQSASRTRTYTWPSRAMTKKYVGSTPMRSRPVTAATASRVSAPGTTRAITPRTCSTPTATTSRSSTTTTSPHLNPNHPGPCA
jgi:catechol 2,3-dioxygenase-like lactoylglutathione lyase family enzyme